MDSRLVKNLSKRTRKQLRELLLFAYKKELEGELQKLSKYFDIWKESKIDCWGLTDLIHTFHDRTARDLFNHYNAKVASPTYLVSIAVCKGLIKKEDIPEEARESVNCDLAFLESNCDLTEEEK